MIVGIRHRAWYIFSENCSCTISKIVSKHAVQDKVAIHNTSTVTLDKYMNIISRYSNLEMLRLAVEILTCEKIFPMYSIFCGPTGPRKAGSDSDQRLSQILAPVARPPLVHTRTYM